MTAHTIFPLGPRPVRARSDHNHNRSSGLPGRHCPGYRPPWTGRSPDCACAPNVPPLATDFCCGAGQGHMGRASRPVGRVLCTRVSGPAAIHLGLPLPAASCGLPASIGRATLNRSRRPRVPKNARPL
jgi:hypothetical protein